MDRGALLAKIKANRDRLDACPRHRFEWNVPPGGVARMFGGKVRCHNCEGEMPLVELGAYVRGFAAAGGDPNDVLPGWHEPASAPDEGDSGSERRYFGQPDRQLPSDV